jgi:hypothetical protein
MPHLSCSYFWSVSSCFSLSSFFFPWFTVCEELAVEVNKVEVTKLIGLSPFYFVIRVIIQLRGRKKVFYFVLAEIPGVARD